LRDLLCLEIHRRDGIFSAVWGDVWEWPWLPKERGNSLVTELGNWFYFQGTGQISVVCPVLERPMAQASTSILLASVLEKSNLLRGVCNQKGESLIWDGQIHWLTPSSLEEELRKWHCWLKVPEQFPIWTLPENWQSQGLQELTCHSPISQEGIRRTIQV